MVSVDPDLDQLRDSDALLSDQIGKATFEVGKTVHLHDINKTYLHYELTTHSSAQEEVDRFPYTLINLSLTILW